MGSTADDRGAAADSPWPLDAPAQAPRGSSHYVSLGLLVLASACMVALAIIAEPDARGVGTHEQLGLPPCQMLSATGVPCPGCGVTTSVTLAGHGRLMESFSTQPFGLLLAVGVPLLTLWALVMHLRGEDVYERFEGRRGPWVRVLLVVAALAWIFKIAGSFA